MADSARIAQVTAREIPVTIQGSRIVEGTDRRELFTETVKTTLTFDSGAAVNLKARVAVGQSLFLRNELSGREILCRVIEVPAPGQPGPTDLEFTIHDPEFWSVQGEPQDKRARDEQAESEQPSGEKAIDAQEKPVAREATPVVMESAATPPKVESARESELLPSGAYVPVASPEMSATPSAPSLASSEQAEMPTQPAVPAVAAEVDDAKDAEQLAGIVARYAQAIAKRASDKSAANEAQQQLASDTAQPQAETITRKQKAFSTLAFRLHGIRELTVRKNPIALGIVAFIVIGAALGVSWDVTCMLYPAGSRPWAALVRTKPPVVPAPHAAGPSKAGPAGKAEAASARVTPKIQPPSVAQVPAARIAKNPAATTEKISAARAAKAIDDSTAAVAFRVEPGRSALRSEQPLTGQGKPRKSELGAPQTIPARIVSQYQPSLPEWAKDLDLNGVVTLDAVIDEKGNLKATKLVSGPRVLESAAEGAVGLWIFQPAMSGGKPTTTHMTLTVEFQR